MLGAYLISVGRRQNSTILVANGKHVLTDSWTSGGVLLGVGLTIVTRWLPWDPIFAILAAANIIRSGISLVRESVAGLLDEADPETHAAIEAILSEETQRRSLRYHELRHRRSGDGHWIDVRFGFAHFQPPLRRGEKMRAERLVRSRYQPAVRTRLSTTASRRPAPYATRVK